MQCTVLWERRRRPAVLPSCRATWLSGMSGQGFDDDDDDDELVPRSGMHTVESALKIRTGITPYTCTFSLSTYYLSHYQGLN